MTAPVRLLAIGFDAAPGDLVRRCAAVGELPNLARLIDSGASAALGSLAGYLPESTWQTLVTGCEPAGHGVYNWRETRPGTYVRARRSETVARPPFWQVLRGDGRPPGAAPRVLLLDMPEASCDPDDGATVVAGWGQRGGLRRGSWPADLLDAVEARHGAYADNLNREVGGRPLLERARLRSLERLAARRTAVLRDLMAEHPWELCATAFYESHYAGHAFHQYAKRDAYLEPVSRRRGTDDALLRVYQAIDAGIGSLVDAAPAGTHVAIFSGMGMRPNTNGLTLLPRALEALGYTVPAAASASARRRELLRRAALTAVPRPLARAVRRRLLDERAVDRHMEQLWSESTDWARTRAWAEAEQGSGFIRLNVAGREPAGIVAPGREYDDLCAEIAADLLELREIESGRPAIEDVVHRDELTRGPLADRLPDLLVRWTSGAVVRRAHHPRVGVIEDDGSDWQVSEHDDDGWIVMSGPLVRPGAEARQARIEDIAPTLTHLMGGAVPAHADGRVLTELLAPETGRVRRTPDATEAAA